MILVDGVTEYATNLRFKRWSHMVSTTCVDELHAFAARLGLKRSWFQDASFAHYDIVPTKRARAIELGAIAVSSRLILFGNFDYVIKRPGRPVPEPYMAQLRALGVVS